MHEQISWTRRIPMMLFLLIVSCLPATPARTSELVESPLLRVILISCDTFSARHLPINGHDRQITTTLDSIAATGVTFRNCLSPQGWTLSAHISMFTGLAPGTHRTAKNRPLNPGIPMLAEILADQGFLNGAFLAANNWLAPEYGFGRGFSIYRFQKLEEPIHRWGYSWLDEQFPAGDARALLRSFFLFYHFMDPHSRPVTFNYLMPYWALNPIYHHYLGAPASVPPQMTISSGKQWDMAAYDPELLGRYYDASIFCWDVERLRPLIRKFLETDLLLDTLLIITADHGEEIAEHGGYFHDSPYAEVRDVPLVMVWPGHLPAGSVVDTPVSLMDITPTILDLAGMPPLENSQGLSLRPLLMDPVAEMPERDFLIDGHRHGYEHHHSALVARADGSWWSLIAATDSTGTNSADGLFTPARVDSLIGLYCLDTDRNERRNVLTENRRLAHELLTRMRRALATDADLARSCATGSVEEIELSDQVKQQLQSLGY